MITQSLTQSFKEQLLRGVHNFDTDDFYLALYTQEADLSSNTTVYSPVFEVMSSGYVSGGLLLTSLGVAAAGGNAYTSFADAVWNGPMRFNVAGGLIYNASRGNASVVTLNFGQTYTVAINNGQDFTVKFPPNTSYTAPIILGGGIYGNGPSG